MECKSYTYDIILDARDFLLFAQARSPSVAISAGGPDEKVKP